MSHITHKPFIFNIAALSIVPVAALKATTAEAQIDALYDVADAPNTAQATALPLLQLAKKLNAKLRNK